MTDFDVSGTLKNMLEDGFTVRDALSEKIDNSPFSPRQEDMRQTYN